MIDRLIENLDRYWAYLPLAQTMDTSSKCVQ